MKKFVSEMRIEAPLAKVWEFYVDPYNLPKLTLPHMHLRVLRADLPMHKGSRIVFIVRRGPIQTRWESVIAEFEQTRMFSDHLVKGPFDTWRHRHEFEADGDGTRVRDTLEIGVPLGFFGRMAAAVFLDHEVHELFRYREWMTRKLLVGKDAE